MAKRYKIILSVLLVVLVAVAAVVVSGVFDINKRLENGTPGIDTENGEYTDVYKIDTSAALPLMKTGFENVFFTMTKQGDVKFYEASNGTFTEIEESGNFETSAECSGQTLPAVIHYLERDGKTEGYGLFTNLMYPDVLLYDYAFFKMTELPASAADSHGTMLLMLDVDNERFYNDEKIYSEIFSLYADHTTKHFLSEEQRIIDINARLRTDYKMFTDDILPEEPDDRVLFFSARNYVEFDESDKCDIFTSGGSYTNVDNIVYLEDVATLNFWKNDGRILYFRENEEEDENGDITFVLNASDGNESETVETFTGDPDVDYIISGHYMLDRLTGEIYDILTGETRALAFENYDIYFAPDMFTISDNGRFCVIRGTLEGKAACGIADLETDRIIVYSDDIFGYIANVQALNDGTVILSVANGESGTAFYQLTAALA